MLGTHIEFSVITEGECFVKQNHDCHVTSTMKGANQIPMQKIIVHKVCKFLLLFVLHL